MVHLKVIEKETPDPHGVRHRTEAVSFRGHLCIISPDRGVRQARDACSSPMVARDLESIIVPPFESRVTEVVDTLGLELDFRAPRVEGGGNLGLGFAGDGRLLATTVEENPNCQEKREQSLHVDSAPLIYINIYK